MKQLLIATAAAVGLVTALPASAQTSTVTNHWPKRHWLSYDRA